ncbi:protein TALPID3-like isoform X2 [Brachyhypopomus gauderio]|uniref:protein TALPID3-like isoform X2 n=1 Tax=Brachyhypopomus gauderio TaxID=698409 RepID=UPI00404357FB
MKSSKTQTSMSGVGTVSSLLRPTPSEPQYLFSPSSPAQEQLAPGSPLRGFLIPMAIPLGQPRVDGQVPVPSRVILSDKPAVVTTSVHRAPGPAPKPAPPIDKPNTVLLEVRSEPKRPAPQLQIQVQPSVNIDGVKVAGSAPSPPVLPAPPIQAGARARTCPDKAQQEDQQEHQQEDGFPGSRFLGVADVSQEPELETECLGSPIELNGLPSAPAALYHGPAFPLQPAPPTLHPEQGLGTTQNTLTLEDRLVDWVEQQLMARVISGMFPPPDPTNQSEPAESVTSDIEAAGGDGPFAHAGVPVDSELVRQCVNEVLAEIIAATLHQRQRPGEQDTHTGETAVPTSVPTPVPTPEPSVKERPALKEAPSPVSTPTLSEQPSPAQSPRGSHPPTPQKPASPDLEKAPVDTPTSTPAPSPRRSATPSPTPELQSLRNHPWGEAELPLKEEDPHSEEEELGPQPIVLTVAREEEVDAVIPPPFPDPPKPQRPPSVFKEPPPAPPESLFENGSSSRSSPTLTETEAAARHISEGELLLSSGQMAVIRALEEEGVAPPNPMMSFNSSLHGVQDMDYDPPSEGQVVRRPLVPAHHDPVLSLLARMEQGPASQSQQPQGCWDEESSGEVSEGQRPLLTTLQQRVVTGHSLLPQEPTGQASLEQSPHTTLSSPGQLHSQFTGWEGAPAEGAGLSVIVKTTEEPTQTPDALLFTPPPPPQTDHATHQQEPECPRPRPRPALILVKQSQALPESGAEMSLQASGSGWPISITLPSVQPNDRSPSNQSPSNQSPSISTIEGDSCSASDVF